MKSSILLAVVLMFSGCGFSNEPSTEEVPRTDESIAVTAPDKEEAIAGGAIGALTNVWQIAGQESCQDLCPFSGCSSTCPRPQCPAGAIPGQPCTYTGTYCFRRGSATEMICGPLEASSSEPIDRSKL